MNRKFRQVLPAIFLGLHFISSTLRGQSDEKDRITVLSTAAGGNVHMLYCKDGFGGGNVAASVGKDGILLVDNMFAFMAPRLEAHLKTISDKPVRLVLNTHYHRDHIEANSVFRKSAIIIAHENVEKQLVKNAKEPGSNDSQKPMAMFKDRMVINFNDEEIQMIHFPASHTDGDAMIYFTKSKVIHLGDMFFFGMFPGVYTQGGGDIKGLIVSLESILQTIPSDVKVIPGHGDLATMGDLRAHVTMLKETTGIVKSGIAAGKTLEQMKAEKVLAAYDALGSGGAQTTDQYLVMLYNLLK